MEWESKSSQSMKKKNDKEKWTKEIEKECYPPFIQANIGFQNVNCDYKLESRECFFLSMLNLDMHIN